MPERPPFASGHADREVDDAPSNPLTWTRAAPRTAQSNRARCSVLRSRADFRDHGPFDRSSGERRAGFALLGRVASPWLAADRNGRDVPADEPFPLRAVAGVDFPPLGGDHTGLRGFFRGPNKDLAWQTERQALNSLRGVPTQVVGAPLCVSRNRWWKGRLTFWISCGILLKGKRPFHCVLGAARPARVLRLRRFRRPSCPRLQVRGCFVQVAAAPLNVLHRRGKTGFGCGPVRPSPYWFEPRYPKRFFRCGGQAIPAFLEPVSEAWAQASSCLPSRFRRRGCVAAHRNRRPSRGVRQVRKSKLWNERLKPSPSRC